MEYEKNIRKHNVFQDQTTYRNDYRKYVGVEKEMKIPQPTERDEKPVLINTHPPIRDFESLYYLRDDACVPFDLFWEPRPIVGTDPRSGYEPRGEIVDTGKEEAIRTRPRLYMSPAVSMDDVPDPGMRDLLCRYMYTSEWRKSEREAATPIPPREVPSTTLEAGNPVAYKMEVLPPLPPGWRQKGVDWDNEQVRAMVDPTRTFWLDQEITPKCEDTEDPLKKLVPKEVMGEIETLIRKEELRIPHDLHHSTYAGYKPANAYGVTLAKNHFPVVHPMLTVQQALATRLAQDDIPLKTYCAPEEDPLKKCEDFSVVPKNKPE